MCRACARPVLKRCAALIALTLALAACGHTGAPSAGAGPQGAGGNSAATSAATAGPNAPVSAGDLNAAAKQEQESANGGSSSDAGEASLERVASLPPAAQLPAGRWVAGTHYTVLSPAQPDDASPGRVKVTEVFWYGCPHCYALDPYLASWQQSKAAYIDFERVPVMWGEPHHAHAHLFYALQALGKLDALHAKVFDAIQQRNDPLFVAGDPKATLAAQEKFAVSNGISPNDFDNAYNSFSVQSELQKADELGRRYRIDGVPTIIIDGKYETDVEQAGGDQQLIQLINDLAAGERRLQGG